MKSIPRLYILFCVVGMVSCTTTQQLTSGSKRTFVNAWKKSGLSKNQQVGLSIYDPLRKETLISDRADNYFTSASNTKILTLYAALQLLTDTIVAAKYIETKDSLFIWGAGDPGTGYPNIKADNALVNFLSQTDKVIVFSNAHFKARRFGQGWAWDDYPYAFQCERNALPLYGNRIWFEKSEDTIQVIPNYLTSAVSIQSGPVTGTAKSEWGDRYIFTSNPSIKRERLSIPITFFENDTRFSWEEITGKTISNTNRMLPEMTTSIFGSLRDSLLKVMMQESDNFVAEQLLLNCSFIELGYLSDIDFIKSFKQKYLFNLPNEVKWYDGSGLSRYNALTPASIIDILERIYQLKGKDYITTIFAAGGLSGTIREYFKGPADRPYVYAKSGSLKNIYCLSGYLITKSGKTLVFSWMNNNIKDNPEQIKSAFEQYLLFVCDHY